MPKEEEIKIKKITEEPKFPSERAGMSAIKLYDKIEEKPLSSMLHRHTGTDDSFPVDYDDLLNKPILISRTAISADLSGAAVTLVCLHTGGRKVEIINAYLLYTEASSADAGITVQIGKESDTDYYYTGTSEVSKAQWYEKEVVLLKRDLDIGDTILFTSAGSKVGTGEIMLIIEYRIL